mmetsp:Transcript_90388/g.292227  ORF Transcript_90388/g.292227 Transcript_90388/m.292227 type:complete len:112 (-) Transcript_90388:90-425(-)|eukprot:CAMPEP_0203927378 /NCGR_PEP_ID=MMETSP0359-20131031/66792_1 /ASSEMBLY_ACC=CAM_ASM_000338 /TAXON_ID=268821 /ORGANISM="Scrippsiella Hangoei, Strain SHTV-5" /LENGTH=111 /DNA_ID=CAMNT_0050856125 /DNA_START=72 /DNA_END=407 /DNA_ORIENTATION=-
MQSGAGGSPWGQDDWADDNDAGPGSSARRRRRRRRGARGGGGGGSGMGGGEAGMQSSDDDGSPIKSEPRYPGVVSWLELGCRDILTMPSLDDPGVVIGEAALPAEGLKGSR